MIDRYNESLKTKVSIGEYAARYGLLFLCILITQAIVRGIAGDLKQSDTHM